MSTKTISDLIADKRAEVTAEAAKLVANAEAEGRDLTDAETEIVERAAADVAPLDARAKAVAAVTRTADPLIVVKSEPVTYHKGSNSSFIRDHALVQFDRPGAPGARDRLARHAREVEVELRAGSTTDTAGGTFVPPLWVLSEYVGVPRSGRAAANLARTLPLPAGTDSINIPTITTGLLAAIQATENSAITTRDMVTSSTTADVTTVAGNYDFSIQQLEQSPLAGGWDQLVFADLNADRNRATDVFVLSGSGTSNTPVGISTAAATSVTVSTAAGTALYQGIADAINRVATSRYAAPEVIVMHPRRWFWLASRLDTTGRPLVTPDAQNGINLLAAMGITAAEGVVGTMLGLPVVIDANVTTTGSTYYDEVYVWRASDSILMESAPRFELFRTTGGSTDTLTARARLYNYAAFTPRFSVGIATVTGAGLTGPTF